MTHTRQDPARRRSSRPGFGKWRRVLALSGLMLLLAPGWGCEDDTDLGLGVSCITFVPDAVPTDGEVVARLGAESSCDVVVVELVVTGVPDVFAASFEIDFPQEFSAISVNLDVADSFLGPDLIQELQEISPGVVEGGVSRVGVKMGGVTPDENNNLLFKVGFLRFASSGSGALSFNDANLQIVEQDPGQDPEVANADPVIPFRGGTLMVIDGLP